MARQFGPTTQEGGLGDTEQRRRRAGLGGDGGLDLGQEARLGPLTHVRVVSSRPDEVVEKSGHLRPRRGAHGQARRPARRRGLELAAVRAVRQAEQLRSRRDTPAARRSAARTRSSASHFPSGTRPPRPPATADAISRASAWRSFTTGSPVEGVGVEGRDGGGTGAAGAA